MDQRTAFRLVAAVMAIGLMWNVYQMISWLRTGIIAKTSQTKSLFKKDEGEVITKFDSPGRYWEVIAIEVILNALGCVLIYYVFPWSSVF